MAPSTHCLCAPGQIAEESPILTCRTKESLVESHAFQLRRFDKVEDSEIVELIISGIAHAPCRWTASIGGVRPPNHDRSAVIRNGMQTNPNML